MEWTRVFRLSRQVMAQMMTEQGMRRALDFAWIGVVQALQGRGLPHTPEVNKALWTHYDWSRLGEEWSESSEWTASVVEHLLAPHVPPGSRVLEIGPGAGRWTQYLLPRASRLVIVDVTPKCLEVCHARFQSAAQLECLLTDDSDLSALHEASFDRIWSWDVFVHVGLEDIKRYLREFSRVLVPGGLGLVQHAAAPYARGWRTAVPAEQMARFCADAGLEVLHQYNTWDNGRRMTPTPADLVTVLAKPPRREPHAASHEAAIRHTSTGQNR